MAQLTSSEKAKKNLKVAQIVYYTIGGIALAWGLFCSVCNVILMNPVKANFSSSWVLKAETAIFEFLHWDLNFQKCGLIFVSASIVYFLITMYIFNKQGDAIDKASIKKSRQRQVVFTGPIEGANPQPTVAPNATINNDHKE